MFYIKTCLKQHTAGKIQGILETGFRGVKSKNLFKEN